MLNDLLVINNVTFPKNPESFELNTEDLLNEFETENGANCYEVVRAGIIVISASYVNLAAEKLAILCAALTATASVVFYNPRTNSTCTRNMKVSGISTPKKYHDHGISTWDLSFTLKEL